jgi:hypothetical protein
VALDLRRRDVLFGRGTGPNEHQGNRMFRSLVKSKKEEHTSCTTCQGKDLLVMKIIQEIHDSGGRFLKKLPNGKHAKGYHYEIADERTIIEKTRQVFQYFRKEQRDSRQGGETAVAATIRTHESHCRDPTTESFSGLITPQSGMIGHHGHHGGNFEQNVYRRAASADGTSSIVAGLPMAILQQEAQALSRYRALYDGILHDLLLTSGPNSASSNCDRARCPLTLSRIRDTFGPNHREPSSILQQEVQDSRFQTLYTSVPYELLLPSHHHQVSSDYDAGVEASLRLLSLAGLSDRFGLIPLRGRCHQPQQHQMSAVMSDNGVLGLSRGYMDHRQLMQLLSLLQEQRTF